jgi:hypothetical protein
MFKGMVLGIGVMAEIGYSFHSAQHHYSQLDIEEVET